MGLIIHSDFDNTNLLNKIKHRLIRWIAGSSVVLLNAVISIVDTEGGEWLHLKNIDGLLIYNCSFPEIDGRILMLEQMTNNQSEGARECRTK